MFRQLLTAAVAASSLLGVSAAPTEVSNELAKRANLDVSILQFALTLEHLENAFYEKALKTFSLQDFESAGYSADYYNNLKYIAYDEQQHVLLLEAAIKKAGYTPEKACTYKFPFTDVLSFITLSSLLEGTGTSAYLGAAPLITNKQYLTVAGSILAVEALHTSYQRAAIGEVPNANYLYTPIDGDSAYTLASQFIVSCPKGNTPLPFTAFPYLYVEGTVCSCEEPSCGQPSEYIKRRDESNNQESCSPPTAGQQVTFYADKKIPSGSYVTFVNGLTITSVKGVVKGKDISAKIPTTVGGGQTYVFVTSADVEGTFQDSKVLFGPALLEVTPAAPVINYSIH